MDYALSFTSTTSSQKGKSTRCMRHLQVGLVLSLIFIKLNLKGPNKHLELKKTECFQVNQSLHLELELLVDPLSSGNFRRDPFKEQGCGGPSSSLGDLYVNVGPDEKRSRAVTDKSAAIGVDHRHLPVDKCSFLCISQV